MTTATVLRLAWRESRTARRRLALYMSSIAFGVAALVAIDSFANNVTASIREQSRTLVGGDIALKASALMPPVVDTLLDSLAQRGIPHARVTTFASMALASPSGGTRLVQVRAITPGYPFYGRVETIPIDAWRTVHDAPVAFVDPSLLIAVNAAVGDSLRLGTRMFRIAGTLGNAPGDAAIASVIGPRVYISDRWVESTGLLKFGSRASYDVVLQLTPEIAGKRDAAKFARTLRRRIDPRLAAMQDSIEARRDRGGSRGAPVDDTPDSTNVAAVVGTSNKSTANKSTANNSTANNDTARNGKGITDTTGTATATTDTARTNSTRTDTAKGAGQTAVAAAPQLTTPNPRTRVRIVTVASTEADLTEAVGRLADFLSIIGLIALLLGGVGVASGVNAFVSAKIDTVAVLRCLGATSRQVLGIYLVQAVAMGLVGASAGALLGVGIQFLLPRVVADFLPVDVHIALELTPLAIGLSTGVWVALVFALRPLLALRNVSPLQAIRREADSVAMPSEWKDPARLTVDVLLVSSLVGIILFRLDNWRDAMKISGAIAVAIGLLWFAALLLIAGAKRATRSWWPFTLRQGIANLHRPSNQTRAVTLALGFGAFLLSTVYLVQANILGQVQATANSSAGNLLLFDVQDNQASPLDSMLRAREFAIVQRTPIVTMRIDAINGRGISVLMADTSVRRAGWGLRREYRSTYRDDVVGSEKVVAGAWFADSATRAIHRAAHPDAPFDVSFERDLAANLKIGIGDTVTWNVQGVPVRTVVSSLRTVNFARFEANFFVVFAPEAIRRAPQQYVFVANVPAGPAVATIQRDIVQRFPNVSSLDLTLVRETIGSIVNRVILAVRFLGLFSLAMGIPVLFSAVAATRRARLREGVLLRTLGATRMQVAKVLLAEYGALGALGALTGMLLAFAGAWGLSRFVFHDEFHPAVIATVGISIGMLTLTMAIGWITSRDVYRATPMAAIRES